jgi:hypothetical protein
MHPSGRGHAIMAEEVIRSLRQEFGAEVGER